MPLFFIGLASLAFSQLENAQSDKPQTLEQVVREIENLLAENESRIDSIQTNRAQVNHLRGQNLLNKIDSSQSTVGQGGKKLTEVKKSLIDNKKGLELRVNEVDSQIKKASENLASSRSIFEDLNNEYAGRMDEVITPVMTILENLRVSKSEILAVEKIFEGALSDYNFKLDEASSQVDELLAQAVPEPPSQKTVANPRTQIGRRVADVIKADSALPTGRGSRFSGIVQGGGQGNSFGLLNESTGGVVDEDQMINQLKTQLESSKLVQTELSADSIELKSDLRKAYKEIVSLQTNLKESKLIIEELERAKNSLYQTVDGGPATAAAVSQKVKKLETELDQARDDLRQSRQSLLLEQQRSNSMISSITSELERTRKELDYARMAVRQNSGSSQRLAYLENELAKAKSALSNMQTKPVEPGSEEYLDLQSELRKALSEIASMQIELSQKNKLQDELIKLKSSMEQIEEVPSRGASPAFVNKLMVELNAANAEIERLQSDNLNERGDLSDAMLSLQDELKRTKEELQIEREAFARSKEEIAKREFDFASTIKELEEELEVAQTSILQSQSAGLPTPDFIAEIEENIAGSESRIRTLSEQFANEQAKADDVIEGLKVELEMAEVRQKQSLNELARKEFDLKEQGEENQNLRDEKKKLEEELEVVKVIAAQLQDLNEVLEDTKKTQFQQSGTSDEIINSLKDELNKAKIELVVTVEERDKLREEYSERIESMERQLEDARDAMVSDQESFLDNTEESKLLITELRTELDSARQEIAKMKTSGITESIETKQAVSQLQEALGTIRILQESLEDAERANLEVDNLKTELADAMVVQLEALQKSDDEKFRLREKITDLETEITVLRHDNTGGSLQDKQNIKSLNEKLLAASAHIELLEQRIHQSEDTGIFSLTEIEDEISLLKQENDGLKSELQDKESGNAATIELLQKELVAAKKKLASLELEDSDLAMLQIDTDEDFARLQLDNQRLVDELSLLKSQLDNQGVQERLEDRSMKDSRLAELQIDTDEDYARLQLDNQRLVDELSSLKNQLDGIRNTVPSNTFPGNDTSELSKKVELVLNKISEFERREGGKSSDEQISMVSELENDLSVALAQVDSLNEKLQQNQQESASSRADLEEQLELALSKISELEANSESTIDEEALAMVDALEKEVENAEITISSLREELIMRPTRQELEDSFTTNKEIRSRLESQLEEALAKINELEENNGKALDEEALSMIASLEQEVMKSQEEVNRLRLEVEARPAQAELDSLNQSLLDATEKLSALDIELADMGDRDEEIAILKQELENAGFIINDLQTQLDQRPTREMLGEMKDELDRMREELAAVDNEEPQVDIESLMKMEEELMNAEETIAELKSSLLGARDLELALADARETISVLEKEKSSMIESLEPNVDLEDELFVAKEAIQNLENKLKQEEESKLALMEKLNLAFDRIESFEDSNLLNRENQISDGERVAELESDLALSREKISDLQGQLQEMIAQQAENELKMAMTDLPQPTNEDWSMLENEIIRLKEELMAARAETTTSDFDEREKMQEELRLAISESFELQIELEDAQQRLAEMQERIATNQPTTSPSIDQVVQNAKLAEEQALMRIEELTLALTNSEQLRAETEDLLTELERNTKTQSDISQDPRFIELQEEMLALQNDLISAQGMDDSKVGDLQMKLQQSRDDAGRLNEELKAVMGDFSSLKQDLTSLESENRRLRESSLAEARNLSTKASEAYKSEINRLSRENINLMNQLAEKDKRMVGLRDELAGKPASFDENILRNQIEGLKSQLEFLSTTKSEGQMENDRLKRDLIAANQANAQLESDLRNAKIEAARDPGNQTSPLQAAEMDRLQARNSSLEAELATLRSSMPSDELSRNLQELNQKNMAFQLQLDQERIIIDELKGQLADARNIKQEVLERGKSSRLKIELLNDELADARNRISSLENALVSAREAIRILQGGGSSSSQIQVSAPKTQLGGRLSSSFSSPSFSAENSRRPQFGSSSRSNLSPRRSLFPQQSLTPGDVRSVESGDASLKLQAMVQFLNNKNRPAGFTEFFLVDRDLSDIMSKDGIAIPSNQGIASHAEYWARSVQRGYRFPGVAAKIRNALARASIKRIKTNSLGQGNLSGLKPGSYYLVGASTLGQVGVVWSKPLSLSKGDNSIDLDLGDASWAQ